MEERVFIGREAHLRVFIIFSPGNSPAGKNATKFGDGREAERF